MRRLRQAAALLVEAAWPRRVICLCCQRPSGGGFLCRACEDELAALRITGPVCDVCGHPLVDGACVFCDRTGMAVLRSVWTYRDASRELVHALKFGGVADAASVLADGIAALARTLALPPDTVVTWPTMPRRRRLERGIDHGRLLATAVGERLGLPARQLLMRSDRLANATQVGMNRLERLTRLQGAFSCGEALQGPVLLVDDVMTTSATAVTCAECLLAAGASEVTVITAAQTEKSYGKDERDARDDAVEEAVGMGDGGADAGQRPAREDAGEGGGAVDA